MICLPVWPASPATTLSVSLITESDYTFGRFFANFFVAFAAAAQFYASAPLALDMPAKLAPIGNDGHNRSVADNGQSVSTSVDGRREQSGRLTA